ncbi:MAG: alpha/beta hydrolase [Gemmatimonadetes bacterium]|nr:alpha/beta hydrolase [Gemmatimonadota bacterium]
MADLSMIDAHSVSGSGTVANRARQSPASWLALWALLAATAACARPPAAEPAPAPVHADTVWYVSTRARDDDGRDTRRQADSLEYGLAIFGRPAGQDARADALDLTLADSVRLTAGDFAAALRQRVQATVAPHDYAVFYVHGFGTSLHEAWTFAATSRARAATDAPWVAFCWPSNGSGIARPTLDEPLSQAYIDDSTAAVASRPAFDRALRAVVAAAGAPRVMLVPHSLGSQLVGETLAQDVPLRTLLGAAPLRAVAFMAPDVEARRFAEYLVPAVRPLTDRLLLYTSARDRVLEVSGERTQTQRAGLHPGAPLTSEGLETVDVTDGVSAGGWLQQTFGNHHAIFRATASLFDLAWVVGGRRAPDCRLAIGSAALDEAGVWRLTDSLPNARDVAERCSSPAPGR